MDIGGVGAVFEEGLRGGADRGLMGDVEMLELVEVDVVGLDETVREFEFEFEDGHGVG